MVRDAIARLRPRAVLIEGPADMSARLDELALGHTPPVAIFSFYEHAERTHASFTPFCDYSPEWVALHDGLALGAEVRFIDLPAWSVPFRGVADRYTDRPRLRYIERLAEKVGADGLDAMWDHLFEQPLAPTELEARLAPYFEALRIAEGDEDEAHDEGDRERERFMAQHVAHAMAEGGDVLVVCGGYHKPQLERAWRALPPELPTLPTPEEGARHGSYLVPYSFHRLDRFAGYRSGMPSPGFYQLVWEGGPEHACERMLRAIVERLRKKKQPLSAADLVAVETMARGLMRLRGHAVLARTDLLDAIAAALLKDGQEAPLPWTQAGALRPGTDPMLVEVLAALTGSQEGRLAPGTPRPPLVADVHAELARHGLTPTSAPRDVRLDLTQATELDASRVLHRLRVLGVPGVTRTKGAQRAHDAELTESWQLQLHRDLDAALIEAAAYGPTLEAAAATKLEERLLSVGGDVAALASLLGEALFVGLLRLADRVLRGIAAEIQREAHLDRLGAALAELLALHRHDTLRGGAGSPALGALLAPMVARGLWLFEGTTGAQAPAQPGELRAIVALRDTVKHGEPSLGIDADAVRAVMERKAHDLEAPPAHRGAALGYLWSMGALGASEDEARATAVRVLRASALPQTVGDLLAGLFALAREQVIHARELVQALDALVSTMSFEDLLLAIPALRLAFTFFPPRERDAIARLVLSLHGRQGESTRALRRLEASPEVVLRGVELERRVSELAARYGLAEDAS
jgi:hypothetical protein